jgi:hypothetical protein
MTRSMTPTKDRNTPRGLPLLRTVIVGLVLGLSGPTQLRADITNFDLQGRIYTKWLYQNDDSQGLVTYGNPFWPDNITGTNGVGTEFELKIKGQIS